MRVRLTPEAEADLEQALAWYAERSADLSAGFLVCFEAVFRQVEQFPESAPAVHASLRRALLRTRSCLANLHPKAARRSVEHCPCTPAFGGPAANELASRQRGTLRDDGMGRCRTAAQQAAEADGRASAARALWLRTNPGSIARGRSLAAIRRAARKCG